MKIGLLSDTHGFLDPSLKALLADRDEVWHAGDIGHTEIADTLASWKPLRAVYGNIDDRNMQQRFPENLWFVCEGLTVWMTHIAGSPPHYNNRIKKVLANRTPDLLIAGHSHILKVMKDPTYHFLFLNPGAAGNHGFHAIKTFLRFEISDKAIRNMQVVELGKRGALPVE